MYLALKWIHVIAAAIWLGGNVLELVLGAINRSAGLEVRRRLAESAAFTGNRLYAPTGVLILLTGIGMVVVDGGLEFENLWIAVGIAGVVLGSVNGAALLGPAARGVIAAAESGDVAAVDVAERRLQTFGFLQLMLLVVVFAAMIWRWTL